MSYSKTVRSAVVAAAAWLIVAGESNGQTSAAPATASAPDSGTVDFPIVVRFSEKFLSLLIPPEVRNQEPVDTVILGTRATGRAWTNGTLHLDLKPQARGVDIALCFDGTCVARTVARNGPAILYNTATTTFSARKNLTVDVDSGIQDDESNITATASLPLPVIESTSPRLRGRIVRCVARRRARRVHPQVTAIAQNNAEARIGRSFDSAAEQLVTQYNEDLDLLRPVIQRLRKENPNSSLVFSTTEHHLHLAVGRADSERGPELPDSAFDSSPIQVWLHRSVLGDGNSTAEEQLSEIRRIRTDLEQQLSERFRSRDAVAELLRSVPVMLGTAEEWVVIGLPSADEPAVATNSD